MEKSIKLLKRLVEAAEKGNDELVEWYCENQFDVLKTIEEAEREEKPNKEECARHGDCSFERVEGRCLGADKCHVYLPVREQ